MAPNDTPILPHRHAALCPICGKPVTSKDRPFCSTRCRNIDLGRWLRGVYRVETEEDPEEASNENP